MTKPLFPQSRPSSLVARSLLATFVLGLFCSSAPALTLYRDSFETYPVQNPAPSPLTNGPAGGQWFFVGPNATFSTNDHRIWDSTTVGAGFNSRVWASLTNGGRLTNALSLSKLPVGASQTLRLSFVVAADTLTAGRGITFGYNFRTTGGSLALVSAGNADGSQVLSAASGTALASSEVKGKSDDRRFQFVFNATGLSPADSFIFDLTRITNVAGANITFLLDDVELLVDETTNPPVVLSAAPVYSLEHARIAFTEPLDPVSATNTANYSIPGLSVLKAWLLDSRQVELQTAPQTPGATYTVTVSGVLGQNGVAVAATAKSFRAPNLGISPVRYSAGTAPAVAPDPSSPEGSYWAQNVSTKTGMTTNTVSDDLGWSAWQITDNNSASTGGSIVYSTPVDPQSDMFAWTNGWRLVLRSRYTTNFGSTAGCHVALYGDPTLGIRFGILLGINANGLFATLLGGGGAGSGNTYTLTDLSGATNAYHTHVLAYDPVKATTSYYFDGRLIVPDFGAQVVAGVNGVQFGSASSTAKGEMNYNLVQFDVVNATAPVFRRQPQNSTNGVGQTVTFTAEVSPFVNSLQWLSNDVPIAGATATNYTTSFITLANDGDQYKLRAFSAFSNVDSVPARLTVTSDTNPPTIVAIKSSPMLDRVQITFSEPVLEAYATDPANYTWGTSGLTTLSVVMVDPFTVEIRTTPMSAGNVYTVQVNNIRDTSNLMIASNTSSTFHTPRLSVVARYYAGTPDDSPAGPPDPTSAAGGNWTQFASADPLVTTNAVFNDGGWHAWQVSDQQTADNKQFNYYYFPMSADAHSAARQFGWVLSVRAKLISAPSTGTSAIFAQYEDDRYFRNILNFAFDSAADLRVGLGVTNAFTSYTVTSGGIGFFDYHLHQIAYDPISKTTSYYCDGALIKSGWAPVYIGTNSTAAPLWGAVASIPTGVANFNLFELSVVDGPSVSVVANGANVDVSYRGVLEKTAQLNPPVWVPVATNSASATAVYSVPASSQPALFFRARALP